MAYNKISFNKKVLLDISTNNTVTAGVLLTGIKAHDKAGNSITGTFLQGYPSSFTLEEMIQDESGNPITDASSNKIFGWYLYEKSNS